MVEKTMAKVDDTLLDRVRASGYTASGLSKVLPNGEGGYRTRGYIQISVRCGKMEATSYNELMRIFEDGLTAEQERIMFSKKRSRRRTKRTVKRPAFLPPTVDEVIQYAGPNFNSDYFVRYYDSRGWKCGSRHITDWKNKVDNWKENDRIFKLEDRASHADTCIDLNHKEIETVKEELETAKKEIETVKSVMREILTGL